MALPRHEAESRPLAEWRDWPCLVLLGEGGLGKSDELREEQRRLETADETVLLADLGRTTDRNDLRSKVLPEVPDEGRVTLLIDGFDEVFADVADVADVLTDYVTGLDPSRVSLRIASRPAVWSTLLERELAARWDGYVLLALEPPSGADIGAAAVAVLGADDADSFVSKVADRDLWTLATSPNTLAFLLDGFAADGDIPGDRLDIYRNGVARLASERHERRLDRGRTGAPTPQRVAAARTVAFLSMLSGQPVMSTKPLPGGDLLDLDDIGGVEGHDLSTLRDIAQSALMRPSGPGAVTWVHRGYAEFLAAEQMRDLPLPTLLNLLGHPKNPVRIAPPLRVIASWVAYTRDDLFGWLVDHDLEVLLDVNLADAAVPRRRRAADAVIQSIVAGRGFDWRSTRLSALSYDGLADALRAPLTAIDMPADIKAELLHIVWQTRTTGLADELLALVDEAAPRATYDGTVSVGRWAVIALGADLSTAVDDHLEALVAQPTTNRWVRADLLERLHPTRIDTTTMLRLLPHDTFTGYDSTFLGLVQRARDAAPDDRGALLGLLDWLADQPESAHHDHFFEEAFDDAAAAAVAKLDDDDVTTRLARLLARHAEHGSGVHVPPALRDIGATERRQLLATVADEASDPSMTARMLSHALVAAGDFLHYIELAIPDGALDGGGRHWVLNAAHAALMDAATHEVETLVEEAKQRHPAVAEQIETHWGRSWRATRADALASAQRWAPRNAAERAESLFDESRLAIGVREANWEAAARELHKRVGTDEPPYVHLHRISHGAAWQALGDAARDDVLDLALEAATALPHRACRAVADALGLLADVAPDRLDSIPTARWPQLAAPLLHSTEDPDVCGLVVDRAAVADRGATDAAVITAIRKTTAAGHANALDRLARYRPAALDGLLIDLAQDPTTPAGALARLLADLLHREVPAAAGVAFNIVVQRPERRPEPDEDPGATVESALPDANVRLWRRAVTAAARLAVAPVSAVAGVDIVGMLTADWDFTCDVARHLGVHNAGELFASLSPDELAELYIWVDRHLIRREYAPGAVYDVDSVQDLPNTIVQAIGGRENDDAVAALSRIATYRSSVGIAEYAQKVQRAADSASWQPLSVAELREILADADRRAITTPAQLAEVVRVALEEYAHDVRTDAALRRRLWVPTGDNVFAPRGEEEVSDELARELRQRLDRRVSVSREVRVEPRLGAQAASDVDLLVTVADGPTAVSCIVEVKANWFPKLVDCIAAQLVTRYLAGPVTDAGVFCVMWFAGSQWCGADVKSRKPLKDRARFDRRLAAAMEPLVGHPVHAIVIDCTLEQHA